MPQQYLSTDPNAGTPMRPTGAASTPPPNATLEFFGSHRPTTETGQPLEGPGVLDRYVNPALQGAARPTSLTDMVNLLIPGQLPRVGMAAVNVARRGVRGLGRAAVRSAAAVGDVVSPDIVGVASPRLGKALELAQRVRAKLETPPTAPAVSPAGIPSGAPPAAAPPVSAPPAPTPSALRLTAEESQAFRQLVDQGYDEAKVVQAIVQQRRSAPSAAVSTPAPPSGKPTLAAAETKEYQRLLSRGKSPQEAMDLIVAQRAFQQQKRLPTSEQTRQSVYDRNETGRWPE